MSVYVLTNEYRSGSNEGWEEYTKPKVALDFESLKVGFGQTLLNIARESNDSDVVDFLQKVSLLAKSAPNKKKSKKVVYTFSDGDQVKLKISKI